MFASYAQRQQSSKNLAQSRSPVAEMGPTADDVRSPGYWRLSADSRHSRADDRISVKHLDRYLSEFTFRYNRRQVGEGDCMNDFLSRTAGRLTYKR
jgi:hypothetical protein